MANLKDLEHLLSTLEPLQLKQLERYKGNKKEPKPKEKGLGYTTFELDEFDLSEQKLDIDQSAPDYQRAVENPACYAVWFPIDRIYTDPKRFQNRETAFSELSANQVFESFDLNKFDPIVIWLDGKTNKHYVLSGHSRLEGFKKLNKENIPVRFFSGSEGEAIQFAKLEANRAATSENLIEDLNAYRLAVEGDEANGIKPMSKKQLREIFRNKVSKLDKWVHLNPEGLFMKYLSQENRTEYPYIERFSEYAGIFRKNHPEFFTNAMEDELFYFIYAGDNVRISKEKLFQLVDKRLNWRNGRLFPECNADGCKPLKDLDKVPPYAGIYQQIAMLSAVSNEIRERLRANDRGRKIYTDQERQRVLEELQRVEAQIKRAKEGIEEVKEATQTLFGIKSRLRR